ncbi:MAG: hypothetical protein M1823_005765 [Watsoniomyces obsoletus]|nr:MAG: hypothetical protein M1823_005765 [Watsoniomyces obsoletus]
MATLDELIDDLNNALIVSYCVFGLAIFTTVVRLVTRARLLRQLGSDDWLIGVAMVIGIALVPLQEEISKAVRNMLEALFVNGPPGMAPPSPEAMHFGARAGRLNYVAGVLYLVEIGTIKISILAFYRRFVPKEPYYPILYALGGSIVIFTLATVLAFIFQCTPVSGAWDMLVVTCRVDVARLQLGICIFNLLTDIFILLLPIPTVWQLQVNIKKKLGLIILFSLGVLGTVVTALRTRKVVELTELGPGNLVRAMLLVVDIIKWSQLEINLIITCANCPAFAALWKHMHERRPWVSGSSRSAPAAPGTLELGSASSTSDTKDLTSAGAKPGRSRPGHIEFRSSSSNDIVRSTTLGVQLEERAPSRQTNEAIEAAVRASNDFNYPHR